MLNQWTVDLKQRLLVLTDDPTNKDLHRIVIRANTHKRARLDNSRFSSSITVDLPFRDMTDIEMDLEKGQYISAGQSSGQLSAPRKHGPVPLAVGWLQRVSV